MRLPLLKSFAALTTAFSLFAGALTSSAAPEPGRYVGTLVITKHLPEDEGGLSLITANLQVIAQISQKDAERTITILAAVPESPVAAFNTVGSVIKGTFQADGSCIIHGPPFGYSGGGFAPGGPTEPYRGLIKDRGTRFTLRHESIPDNVAFLIDPHLTFPYTTFKYSFSKVLL